MSHFAEIDENGVVVRVLVIEQSEIDSGRWGAAESWIQASYTGKVRTRFPGVGYIYDRANDEFFPPKPEGNVQWDEEQETWVPA